MYHPVRLVGKLISLVEKITRNCFPKTKKGERAAGVVFGVVVVAVTTAVPVILLYIGYHVNFWLGFGIETVLCYWLFATKSLKDESMKVYKELENAKKRVEDGQESGSHSLDSARYAVSMIVGRDTKNLDEQGITKATVETIAENTSDGILAPLFYMMIGGAILGWAYKAVNTMDSMVGYKNDKYQYFGTFAAKLDDVVNYVPARISAWLMIAAAYLMRFDGKNAAKIHRRDHGNHASPNSAQTESVMAGALDVQLAGNAYYFGKLYEKPTIGDAVRPIEILDIKRANQLLYGTAVLSVAVMGILRMGLVYFAFL